MRVLESETIISYNMGKNKKHRMRKAKENEAEDSSDDAAQGCAHVTKAVNLAAMRKSILKTTTTYGECALCTKETPKEAPKDLFGGVMEGPLAAVGGDEAELVEATVCVCLQCGHQGCDRNSANKHALKHYKTPHSSPHCIILNLTTWSTWCYACDEEVPPGPRIQSCIDFLYKQSGLAKPEPLLGSLGRAPDSPMAEASSLVNSPASKSSGSCVKVKGLNNLGNTCFFNAVMQSICQTRGLESLLLEWSKQGKLCTIVGPEPSVDSDGAESEEEREETDGKALPNIQTSCSDPGPITMALLSFLQEMKGGTTRNGTVNPNALFTQVCKKAPRFKGFQQQDSHELLRYLIDCIRTEEVKRGQISILKFFKLPENANPKKVDDETKGKIKEYGRQVKHTFLDSLFGGQLVSTVKCEECKAASQVFEAFLDLSLPVMEEKPQRPQLVLIGKKKDYSLADQGEEGGAAAAAAGMGLDLEQKPSKYMERKNKKLQKMAAKRKGKGPKAQGDTEDKPGTPDQLHGSDDSSKVAGEGSSLDCSNVKVGQTASEPILAKAEHCGLMSDPAQNGHPPGGSTHCRSADSSPEGSRDGLEEAQQEDPFQDSDADIEDNLETDMSRLEISVSELNKSVTSSNGVNSNQSANNAVASQNSISMNSNEDILNNNVINVSTGEENKNTDAELISELKKVSLTDSISLKDTVEGSRTFSCEVTVCNHIDKKDSILDCDIDRVNCETSIGESNKIVDLGIVNQSENISATFNVSLPDVSDSANKCVNIEGENHSKESNLVQAKIETSQIKDHQPALGNGHCQDSQDKHQTNHKSRQETLRDARVFSLSTLAPRYHPAPRECSVMSCLNQFTAAELLTGSNKVSCRECTRTKRRNSTPKAEKKGKDTVYSNASKQYLIFRPPAVLTLHLKRFEQTGLTSRKVNRHVDFPLLLDLAPYCSSLSVGVSAGQTSVLYGLYGLVEHSGRLNGGHYTAYIKVRPGLAPHGQFLHTAPPGAGELMAMFMERLAKSPDSQSKGDHAESLDKDSESALAPGRWFHISDSRVNEVTEAEVLKAQAYLLFYERTL